MTNVMERFYDPETREHNPCSNFSQHGFWLDGVWWDTNEHWYQAHKDLSPETRERIRTCGSPGQAKRLGGKGPQGIVLLRSDWDAVKLPIMRIGLQAKFTLDNEAGQFLLETGDALLVEGNTWGDHFWGVDGYGENWLGALLMSRRAELRAAL